MEFFQQTVNSMRKRGEGDGNPCEWHFALNLMNRFSTVGK